MVRKREQRQTGLIMQGGVLAVVFLFGHIVFLLKQVPLTNVIGDVGNSVYSAAYETYFVLSVLSSLCLPTVLSYLLKPRVKQGHFRSAGKVVQASLIYGAVSGILCGGLLFFGSNYISEHILLEPLCAFAMKILAPAIVLSALGGVLRGYFQGYGASMPIVVSVILEQAVILAVGFPMADVFGKYGAKVGALLQNEWYSVSFGVAGFMVGILSGAFISLLFLSALYLYSRNYFKRSGNTEPYRERESFGQVFYVFLVCLLPIVFYEIMIAGHVWIEQFLFRVCMDGSLSSMDIAEQWGVYYGRYKIWTGIPVALAVSMAYGVRGKVRMFLKRDDYQRLRDYFQTAFHAVMLVVLPLSVLIGALSSSISDFFYPGKGSETGEALILTGCISSVFFAGAFLCIEFLMGMKKVSAIILWSALAVAVHIGFLYGMLEMLHLDIYGVLYADILYSFCLCLLFVMTSQRTGRFRNGLFKKCIPCIIASCISGVIVFILRAALTDNIKAGIILLLLVPVGIVVYFILLLLLRGAARKELMLIPGGRWICRLGELIRLL